MKLKKSSIEIALEICIEDMQDAMICSQDNGKGCELCRLADSPLCACNTGEPTPKRCFNAIKKQLMELGIRDSLDKNNFIKGDEI